MELTIIPNIELTQDDKFLINFNFEVPINTETGVCAVENPTCMGNNDTLLLTTTGIKDICEILDFSDSIIGDIDLLEVDKTFRYSMDNSNYSNWLPLNDESIKNICGYNEVYVQFRYVSYTKVINFNNVISPINKPDNEGWFKLYNGTSFYQFNKDYPKTGNLNYSIGYGTNGQIHYDDSTDRFHYKNSGYWSSPYIVVRNESTSGTSGIVVTYTPNKLLNTFLSDDVLSNASTGGFVPINDYNLSNDIKFGSSLTDSLDSDLYRPMKDDYIFINSLLQGIKLNGGEELFITYELRTLPENYEPKIWLKNIYLEALQDIQIIDSESLDPVICLENVGDQIIFKPDMTLKAFSFDSFCLVVDNISGTNCIVDCLDVKFRHSTTTRRWESNWIPLTDANLSCLKPSALKFFYIEFLFTKICDNNGKPICITDLILNGSYQNVTNDYEKLNKFGIRPDCNYSFDDNNDDNNSNAKAPIEWSDDNTRCPSPPTFNPYDMNLSVKLYEKLANDISDLFGHEVEYYKVEANNAGIDTVLHEYQTYDTTQKEKIKVLVPNNEFPEDQVGFNMFGLSLFDSFEIHITRKVFHEKFGIGNRPGNKDFLFFCQVNKWFEVEHAQSYRDYNNTSVYYKVTLTKKSNDKNIDNREYKDEFEGLIKNNSLDNLFQGLVKDDENKVVNKQIQENLTETLAEDVKIDYDNDINIDNTVTMNKDEIEDITKPDPVALSIFANNIEKDLVNGSNVISRNYYNFNNRINNNAIIYQRLDKKVDECENRAFMVWFNITDYKAGQIYNFINNYNTILKTGYKIDFIDGRIEIVWDKQFFDFDVSIGLNKWYSILVNFNQKQNKIEMFIYTRRDDGICTTDELIQVSSHEAILNAVSFGGDLVLSVKGSPMLWTNMRIFKETVPISSINITLNQYIIKHTELLLVADNSTKVVIAPHWKF